MQRLFSLCFLLSCTIGSSEAIPPSPELIAHKREIIRLFEEITRCRGTVAEALKKQALKEPVQAWLEAERHCTESYKEGNKARYAAIAWLLDYYSEDISLDIREHHQSKIEAVVNNWGVNEFCNFSIFVRKYGVDIPARLFEVGKVCVLKQIASAQGLPLAKNGQEIIPFLQSFDNVIRRDADVVQNLKRWEDGMSQWVQSLNLLSAIDYWSRERDHSIKWPGALQDSVAKKLNSLIDQRIGSAHHIIEVAQAVYAFEVFGSDIPQIQRLDLRAKTSNWLTVRPCVYRSLGLDRINSAEMGSLVQCIKSFDVPIHEDWKPALRKRMGEIRSQMDEASSLL